ncbi:MAG: hypothetical protein JO126_00750 [Alphaproteobacteria bacterium]|nr:hypothetical protein [Alphaproteobacteria bacterium]
MAWPAWAEDAWPTAPLFYTQDEAQRVDAALAQQGSLSNAILHLDAIMYDTDQNWVFWLNGRRWTPDAVDDRLHVLAVNKDSVQLDVSGEQITMRPHQTYWLDKKKVTEGTE